MRQTSVAQLFESNRQRLQLSHLCGRLDALISVTEERIWPADLVGHLNLIHPDRIQIIGGPELAWARRSTRDKVAHQFAEILAARPSQMNCASRAKERSVASWPVRIEHRLRSEAESALRRVAAKACLPEGRGTARCVPAAHVLSLDDHHFRIAGQPRAKARSGNSAADNQDVHFLHREVGYGLERQAV